MSVGGIGGRSRPDAIEAAANDAAEAGTIERMTNAAARRPIDIDVAVRGFDYAAGMLRRASGGDGIVSRREANGLLRALREDGRGLEAMVIANLFKFIDARDSKPGARVTEADLQRARTFFQTKMVEKYDADGSGTLDKAEITKMSKTAKACLALGQKIGARPTTPTTPTRRPGAIDEDNFSESFDKALPAGGDRNARLTKELKLTDIPEPARSAVKRGADMIENRGFPGTDYTAGVDAFYAIYKSTSDRTIVGYAVTGAGSGEPDYSDAMVIGFDTAGKHVHYAEESW